MTADKDGGGEWEFRLLGPVEAYRGGHRIPLPGKQRSLLAVLLLSGNRVVATTRLVDAIWGDPPPASPEARVRLLVSELRKAFGSAGDGLLLTRQPGYLLCLRAGQLDVHTFRHAVEQATEEMARGRPEIALRRYDEALTVWRGAALGGVSGPFVDAEVARLSELRERAAEDRIEAMLALGRQAEVIADLGHVTVEHPLRERPHAQLMLALHRTGRRDEALDLYTRLRGRLVDELGLEPTSQLQRLHQQILAGDPALHPSVPAARVSSTSPPTSGTVAARQLPAVPGRIAGRRQELARLDAFVAAGDRLVLVVGPAGVGKTTLVVRWARDVMSQFPDGQLFLDMRGFDANSPTSAAEALPRLLHALGVAPEEIPIGVDAQVALYRSTLAGRRLLVVLDNVADPDQARPLLPGDPGCVVVITSRDRLGGMVALDGARRVTLDVLPPEEALQVIADTAGAGLVYSDPGAAVELATLCGRLPLALRIAAGRLADQPHQTLRQQVDELVRSGRMVGLQVAGDGRASVLRAFDLSYRMLPSAAQRLFRLLGTMPAPEGWSVEAGAALAGAPVGHAGQLLETLARLHLVTTITAGRYVCHDLLLEYAAELAARDPAGQRDAAVGRLLSFYLHSADQAAIVTFPPVSQLPRPPLPDGVVPLAFPDALGAREWMAAEWDNIAAGIRHVAESSQHRLVWHLVDALGSHLYMTASRPQWLAIAEVGLAAALREGDVVGEAAMHFCLGFLRYQLSQFAASVREYQHALRLYRQSQWTVRESTTLRSMGVSLASMGRYRPALERFTQALALDRETRNERGEGANLLNIACAHRDIGDLEHSARYLEDAISLLGRVGRRPGEAIAYNDLGILRREQGRLEDALAATRKSLAICREIGMPHEEAAALTTLGEVHREAGRHDEAHQALDAALRTAQQAANLRVQVLALSALASVEIEVGRVADGLERLDRALVIAARTGHHRGYVEVLLQLSRAHCALHGHQSAHHYAERALSLAEESGAAIEVAAAHAALAAAYLGLGDLVLCVSHGQKALKTQSRAGQRRAKARTLLILRQAQLLKRRNDETTLLRTPLNAS
ncbi:AfsR/SARP family transcriptional regulator [Micromonospora lupini]|uniref:AfsR/SARP family transcriptional regulator n=1 Tax=Micromonospora lupini TaxID=285679 RepID=UPI0033C9E4D0